MTYRIQSVANARWAVVDERDESVFEGSIRECEDWLDWQENRAEVRPGPRRWWRSRPDAGKRYGGW